MQTVFYTYLYLREDGTPFYVGKGNLRRAFTPHGRIKVPPKNRILIEPHTSEAEALEAEAFLISYYGRKDIRTGYLHNITNGGGSFNTGYRHTQESRQRIGQASKGHTLSPESRKKISDAQRGRPGRMPSKEERLKRSAALKGRPRSEETKRRISAAKMGHAWGKHTIETRKRISESMKQVRAVQRAKIA